MEITIKNVKTFEGNEGIGFNADLYINGKKRCKVIDSADGGCYTYHGDVTDAEEYCSKLPPMETIFDGQEMTFNMDLDLFIDGLVTEALQAKELKKFHSRIKSLEKNHILLGVVGGEYIRKFKLSKNVADCSPTELKNIVEQVLTKKVGNEVILNTNIKL